MKTNKCGQNFNCKKLPFKNVFINCNVHSSIILTHITTSSTAATATSKIKYRAPIRQQITRYNNTDFEIQTVHDSPIKHEQ